MKKPFLIPASFLFVLLASAAEKSEKEQYTLWNPTPRELMREMSTDRPDKTEAPYTVDAGHFQFETDLIGYSYDRNNPEKARIRAETWSVLNSNLRIGLCNRSELQLIMPAYNRVRTRDLDGGATETQSGFGDFVTRLKLNLWGNDGGPTAFAAMPFVKFPTAQDELGNDAYEGGIIFPFALELPWGWSMGAMTEVDISKDVSGSGYHPEFINTITFARPIAGKLAGYVEFFNQVSTESGSGWIGTFDFGFTYALSEDVQLDCGINIGLTRAADDINPFAGISWRF